MFSPSFTATVQSSHGSHHPLYWPEVANLSPDQYKRQSSFFITDILYPAVFHLPGNPPIARAGKDGRVLRPQPVQANMCPARASGALAPSDARRESQDRVVAVKSSELKFGIDRILSDQESSSSHNEDEDEKKETPAIDPSAASGRSFCGCPTSASGGVMYAPLPYPVPAHPMSRHAVHFTAHHRQADNFPGPFSILTDGHHHQSSQAKRKRSWSRAVFSNLQRKGLEKRFDVQKYVTKPDRRQLAAMLGLTDAQVKVWFQNRRMKWRHSKEAQRRVEEDKMAVDKGATEKDSHKPDSGPKHKLSGISAKPADQTEDSE